MPVPEFDRICRRFIVNTEPNPAERKVGIALIGRCVPHVGGMRVLWQRADDELGDWQIHGDYPGSMWLGVRDFLDTSFDGPVMNFGQGRSAFR